MDLIADILAACVNSMGGTAGDGSNCGSLFALTTPGTTAATAPATNTIAALLNLAKNPTLNATGLYALASATGPFQPAPVVTPQDMVVSLTCPAGLTVSTTSLNFGSLTTGATSAAQTVMVSNDSSAPVTVNIVAISGLDPGDFSEANDCDPPLEAGGVCYVEVTASPAASGARSAFLYVGAGGANTEAVALSATGTVAAGGSLQFAPSSVAFATATVGYASAPVSVTIQNTGSTPVDFSGFGITGANAGDFTETNNCGIPLQVGASCTAQFTVTASALGTRAATFNASSDATGSPASVPLSATAPIRRPDLPSSTSPG